MIRVDETAVIPALHAQIYHLAPLPSRKCDQVGSWMQHAQALIKASFHTVSRDFATPLQTCLQAAQHTPPAPPGGYSAPRWPEQQSPGQSQLGPTGHTAGRSSRLKKRARLGQVSSRACISVCTACCVCKLAPSQATHCLSAAALIIDAVHLQTS